jgi:hypothetical protein
MSTPAFRRAVRDQWIGVAFLAVMVLSTGIFLYPVNTPGKIIGFAAILICSAIATISVMRRSLKSCICQNCSSELFAFIGVAKSQNMEARFCPGCGTRISGNEND